MRARALRRKSHSFRCDACLSFFVLVLIVSFVVSCIVIGVMSFNFHSAHGFQIKCLSRLKAFASSTLSHWLGYCILTFGARRMLNIGISDTVITYDNGAG